MKTLTLERARSIVEHAESAFSGTEIFRSSFEPFANAGATSRPEAVLALMLVIAEYLPVAERGSAASVDTFNQYARASDSMIFKILHDRDSSSTETPEMPNRETIESFVGYLRSLDYESCEYWKNVYEHLNLSPPDVGLEDPTSVSAKPAWWKFW